ncbi:S-adenosyl-L-methionine-dependent methyltransferase [Pavlovales sp. CCMP2436]|nr:S-adenosyl-L-methionine-dependent methyltransferase [Pavlovales sp. CCMP2436]
MIGEAEWRKAQGELAAETGAGFLTPVEYFHPWYARAVGRYIVGEHLRRPAAAPLRIVEMGGGNGTCAAGLLGLLREHFPEIYATCRYELVEISPTMAERQARRLRESGIDQERFAVHNCSAIEWARSAPVRPGPSYMLGLELLDNLPHDLVRWTDRGLEQAVVERGVDGSCTQLWEPLADEALVRTVQMLQLDTRNAWQAAALVRARSHPGLSVLRPLRICSAWLDVVTARQPCMYVPTSAALLLEGLVRAEPQHSLVLADFDWLPPQPGGALGAPVVQSKAGEETVDRAGRVLDAIDGECDVFHPSDFGMLERLYRAVGGARARTVKTRDFMREYAELEGTETRSGYNPLVEDFSNTSLLLARASDAGAGDERQGSG